MPNIPEDEKAQLQPEQLSDAHRLLNWLTGIQSPNRGMSVGMMPMPREGGPTLLRPTLQQGIANIPSQKFGSPTTSYEGVVRPPSARYGPDVNVPGSTGETPPGSTLGPNDMRLLDLI